MLALALLAQVLVGASVHAAASIDRSTPRQTVAGFKRAAESGDVETAARYLELKGRPGPSTRELVEQLAEVLKWRTPDDNSSLDDTPAGDPGDGEDIERIATVEAGGEPVPITLVRARRDDASVWLFSAATLARVPELVEPGDAATWVSRVIPERWRETRLFGLWSWQWFGLVLAIAVGLPVGYGIGRLTTSLLRRLAVSTPLAWDDAIVEATRAGTRFAFAWGLMSLLATSLELPLWLAPWVKIASRTPLILVGGWLVRQALSAITTLYLERTQDDVEVDARGLRTQIVILRRLVTLAIALVTAAVVLMQFEVVRTVGWSLLASAGVAGVALGFAAQKSLGDVIAGLQLSMTQPIRLGDAVVLQGQWGQVEEITLTYVRVKLYDERRMIVPTTVFLHEIFENWSMPGDGMIGLVELAVDPTAPVPELRAELERLATAHPAHDGRECVLQLLEVDERRALLRARVSTGEVDKTFQMRCDLREAMLDFLQKLDAGRYLARQRWQSID